MMKTSPIRRPTEEGYVLLAVICMLALLILALSVAVPKVREDIQRDREIETMQRGKQYIRAIKMYYKKFGAYPPNIDALVKTNEIRFLRKRYLDPITGKDDWKPILFGQNKAPTAMGFFGQPMTGATLAGIGPSGGNGVAGASTIGGGLGSSLGGGFGSSASSSTLTAPTGATTSSDSGSTDTSGSSTAATGTGLGGQTLGGTGLGGTGSGGTGLGGQSAGGSGLTGQTFGGAGIIGFSPASPKQSILIYKKKNHYNEWEFVYDPAADVQTISGNTGTIGQSASGISSGIGTSGGGLQTGGGSLGNSPGGASPMAPTAPTPAPQQ
jgi:type II secretory pathway pseudopilin PulG